MKFKIGQRVRYYNPQNRVEGYSTIIDFSPMHDEYELEPRHNKKQFWNRRFLTLLDDPNDILKEIL